MTRKWCGYTRVRHLTMQLQLGARVATSEGGSSGRSQGVKSECLKTAKEMWMMTKHAKENSTPPSDMSDEEQGDLIPCAALFKGLMIKDTFVKNAAMLMMKI